MGNISEYDIKRSLEVYIESAISPIVMQNDGVDIDVSSLDGYAEFRLQAIVRPTRRTNGGLTRCLFMVNYKFKRTADSQIKNFYVGQEIIAQALDNAVISISDGTSTLGVLRVAEIETDRAFDAGYDVFINSCTGEFVISG